MSVDLKLNPRAAERLREAEKTDRQRQFRARPTSRLVPRQTAAQDGFAEMFAHAPRKPATLQPPERAEAQRRLVNRLREVDADHALALDHNGTTWHVLVEAGDLVLVADNGELIERYPGPDSAADEMLRRFGAPAVDAVRLRRYFNQHEKADPRGWLKRSAESRERQRQYERDREALLRRIVDALADGPKNESELGWMLKASSGDVWDAIRLGLDRAELRYAPTFGAGGYDQFERNDRPWGPGPRGHYPSGPQPPKGDARPTASRLAPKSNARKSPPKPPASRPAPKSQGRGAKKGAKKAAKKGATKGADEPGPPRPVFCDTPDLAPLIRRLTPSVVSIRVRTRSAKDPGLGSGFAWRKDRVVTNEHVVRGAREITVALASGRLAQAELIAADRLRDVALLQLLDAPPLPPVTLGVAELEVGDRVLAIGAPMGLEWSATAGIVSAKGRGGVGLYDDALVDLLQTDAVIAPGSSGGPLFNFCGAVVGMTTATAEPGLGFALPIAQVRQVVERFEALK